MRGDACSSALRAVVTDFLGTRDGAALYARRISGLGQRYDLGGTAIRWSARRCRGSGWTTAAGRLELLRGSSEGAGVSGLLVRPDGFVAWASATGGTAGLEAALTRWLGDARKG